MRPVQKLTPAAEGEGVPEEGDTEVVVVEVVVDTAEADTAGGARIRSRWPGIDSDVAAEIASE